MSKLTEIKHRLDNVCKFRGNELYDAQKELEQNAETDLEHLLSLLEEKDKALEFYADGKKYVDYSTQVKDGEPWEWERRNTIIEDCGDIARKALNTSSNNEGEKP